MTEHPNDPRPHSRGARVTIRFSDKEIATLKKRAGTLGLETSALIRAAALDAVAPSVTRDVAPVVTREVAPSDPDLAALRDDIARVALNIRQIARLASKNGVAVIRGSDDKRAFTEMLIEARDAVERVDAALRGTGAQR